MTEMPKRIWAWALNPGWNGGYWRGQREGNSEKVVEYTRVDQMPFSIHDVVSEGDPCIVDLELVCKDARLAILEVDLNKNTFEILKYSTYKRLPFIDVTKDRQEETRLYFPKFEGWYVYIAEIDRDTLCIVFHKREQ